MKVGPHCEVHGLLTYGQGEHSWKCPACEIARLDGEVERLENAIERLREYAEAVQRTLDARTGHLA